MKIQIIFLIVIISNILFTTACKQEVYLEVENISCNLENTSHSNHQKYQDVLDKYAKQGITGISVVISKPNEESWIGSAGYANIEDAIKMNPCHLHHTASLAKSFTGIVTLQLIEEGKLSFDTPIAPFLNDAIKSYTPNVDDLTIKHLLQHTSGIPDIFNIQYFTVLMNNPERIYTTEELLKINEGVEALYSPGANYTYSDPNFMLLSLIIDEIEGNHMEAIRNRVIKPLEFQNMYYHDEAYPFIDGVTANYWEQYNDGKVENISDLQNRLASYILGSDGIIAAPKDMTDFYKKVFEGDLLSEEMLTILKTDWIEEVDEDRLTKAYSHGFMIPNIADESWIGHSGSHIGASCYVYYNLETGATIGVFTNTGTFLSTEKKELVYYDLWNDLRAVVN